MVDIPTSVPVFPDYVDDQDDIMAANQNTPNDELAALCTMVGVLGVAQSKSVDFLDAIVNTCIPTIRLSYTSTTTVTASAGRCFPTNSTATQRVIRKNTSTTAITGSNLDTGGPSFATNTTYFVYGNGDAVATTVTFKASTSSSAPASTTIYQLLGGFATDSSGNVIESTVWSVAGMRLVNFKAYQTGANSTSTGTFPKDNTIPQNTEGSEIMKLDFVPKSASNVLLILAIAHFGNSASAQVIMALFQDSTADALKVAMYPTITSSVYMHPIFLMHKMLAGTINKTTFKIRAGCESGNPGTVYFNGNQSTALFNGTSCSGIYILEFEN